MRSEFLEQQQEDYQSNGLLKIAANIYGWQSLFMLSAFKTTGEYKVPFSSIVGGGGIRVSAIGKKWGVRPVTSAVEAWGLGSAKTSFDPFLYGAKFRGVGRLGAAQLIASRATSFGLGAMIWTDPTMYAFMFLMGAVKPWTLPIAIAGFGGMALWKNTARAMERTRYIDMNQVFPDTQAAFTSRQRAVRAIAESHMQARSAIGNEAQLFHR